MTIIQCYGKLYGKDDLLYLPYTLPIFFCRCREKQRKEASRLQTVNRKLSSMNKLLMEENDRLQKQVSQLVYDNGFMKQQIHTVSNLTFEQLLFSIIILNVHWCTILSIYKNMCSVLFYCYWRISFTGFLTGICYYYYWQ